MESISQQIQVDWRHLVEVGAGRVCATFKREKVQVLINADDIFIRFHKTKKIVLARKGEKLIGTSCTIDDKKAIPSWWVWS